MKKLILILIMGVMGFLIQAPASAQYVTRKAKDSAINAVTKYITWTSTPGNVKGIQLTAVKGTGTPAGTVTLETRIDTVSTEWTPVLSAASLTLTNVTNQIIVWPLNPKYGNGYRIKIVPTGTQKTYLYAAYLVY